MMRGGSEHTHTRMRKKKLKGPYFDSISQLGLTSGPKINFKIPELIKCHAIVKYGKTFYERHTTLTLAVVKIN